MFLLKTILAIFSSWFIIDCAHKNANIFNDRFEAGFLAGLLTEAIMIILL